MTTDYTQYITSQHADKPRFAATVALTAGAFAQIADAALNLPKAFDVDTAVGVQLDIIGLWVGIARKQAIPIAGAFFSWNTAGKGWNEANWKGPYEPDEGIVNLDDDTYRVVIKAKIGTNYWKGSYESVQEIGQSAVTPVGVQCFVLDNLDMTTTVYVLGAPTNVLLEMIKRGLVPPKAAGIRITGYVLASQPGHPFFALSVPTTTETAGLDFGSFGDPP